MPLILETRENWRELLGDAVAKLNELEKIAKQETHTSLEYLRPIMLIQAQPRRGKTPITVEVIKRCLQEDFDVPNNQIARATGDQKDLEGIEILSPNCPIRFVITIQALREGWDCPFAYILCSIAEMSSGTAVEQILGRVMRLPYARRKRLDALNQAYAFAASANFAATAESLIDGLIQNGFHRIEAKSMVSMPKQAHPQKDDSKWKSPTAVSVSIKSDEKPKIGNLPNETASKVTVGSDGTSLLFFGILNNEDIDAIKACFQTNDGKEKVTRAFANVLVLSTTNCPAEAWIPFTIPVLAYIQDESPAIQFEASHFRGMLPLTNLDSLLSEEEFFTGQSPAHQAKIDIQDERLRIEFISHLHQQMRFLFSDQGWEELDLIVWLDQMIPHRHDILPAESRTFIQQLVQYLIRDRGLTLDYLVHNKYRLGTAVSAKIDAFRKQRQEHNFQPFLDLESSPLIVTPDCCFTYDPLRYPYNQPYVGNYSFNKHYYRPHIGDFDSIEEERCARFIDALSEVVFWVRNPARSSKAFWFQTSIDKFYPDFVCQLSDGRHLIIEYKGEDRWNTDDSKEKRAIGRLWEERSKGTCIYIMPKGKDLNSIENKIRSTE